MKAILRESVVILIPETEYEQDRFISLGLANYHQCTLEQTFQVVLKRKL